MDTQHFDVLVKARGLAEAMAVIERAIDDVVRDATASGVCRTDLADALNINRATLYRRYFPSPASDQDKREHIVDCASAVKPPNTDTDPRSCSEGDC